MSESKQAAHPARPGCMYNIMLGTQASNSIMINLSTSQGFAHIAPESIGYCSVCQQHNTSGCRRTSYRPMMTILASRERFCLHPDIATAPNKTEACEGATMVGHMDCSYLENAEASWYPQVERCWMSLPSPPHTVCHMPNNVDGNWHADSD